MSSAGDGRGQGGRAMVIMRALCIWHACASRSMTDARVHNDLRHRFGMMSDQNLLRNSLLGIPCTRQAGQSAKLEYPLACNTQQGNYRIGWHQTNYVQSGSQPRPHHLLCYSSCQDSSQVPTGTHVHLWQHGCCRTGSWRTSPLGK